MTVPAVTFVFGKEMSVPGLVFVFGKETSVPGVTFVFGKEMSVPGVPFVFGKEMSIPGVAFVFGKEMSIPGVAFVLVKQMSVPRVAFVLGKEMSVPGRQEDSHSEICNGCGSKRRISMVLARNRTSMAQLLAFHIKGFYVILIKLCLFVSKQNNNRKCKLFIPSLSVHLVILQPATFSSHVTHV
jgi:hypothetical protein